MLVSCTTQSEIRHESFQKAVGAEELYWRGLYNEYLGTFSAEDEANPTRRERKRFTIDNFANRPLPTFSEFGVNQTEKDAAHQRFVDLQKNLRAALRNPASSGAEVATSLQVQDYENDQTGVARKTDGAAPAPVPVVKISEEASIDYETRVLSMGQGLGWDVDVIWCRGEGEGARYAAARDAAQTLADLAGNDRKLTAGDVLGRVRLRSLPESLRDRPDMAGHADAVVYDTGAGEKAVANALAAKLGTSPTGRFQSLQVSGAPTRWYVSVFVCA